MTEGSFGSLPPLVADALEMAEQVGFERSCSLQTGRLLRALAASVQAGVIGEIGTGSGVGASWIVSDLRTSVPVVTVEIDRQLAATAERLLARTQQVRVLHGDWREILSFGPFVLLFADAAAAKQGEPETLLDALQIGGMIVLDDLTPGGTGRPDALRDFWLTDLRVAGSEVLVREAEAVILATRIR